MAERTLPDAAARRQAATDFERNLVVLAGAGTGKTSLLIERVLNAVGTGVARMSEIGAITFTDKAAGEMRERLALGLDGLRGLARGEAEQDDGDEAQRSFEYLRALPEYSADETARRALTAMEQLDTGTVTTIHGFCSELLRSFPMEAGVDPGFEVDSGVRANQLLGATWRAFIEKELGAGASRPETWRRVLAQMDLSQAATIARRWAGFDVPTNLLEGPWRGSEAPEALRIAAGRVADEIDGLLEWQSGLTRAPRSYLEDSAAVLRTLERAGLEAYRDHVRSLPDLLTKVEKKTASKPTAKADPKLKRAAEPVIDEARRLLGDLWTLDEQPARTLLEAAAPYSVKFRERYLGQGSISFDGLLALARDLLRDNHDVRKKLKARYRLLLLDEFQDTDPLQYEIVLFLAEATGDAAVDPFQARLEPGRLFVVGDAKQSIYRFRGADYAAYRRAVDRIAECDGQVLNLVTNFRSVPEVTEPINRLFEAPDGWWRPSHYQPEYVGIESARDRAGEPRVEVWTTQFPEGKVAVGRGREAEGRLIAQAIRRWKREERFEYRDVAILFRSFGALSDYLRPLRELGIPFVVSSGRDFLERPEVAQLMAIFGCLAQTGEPADLLAFLRSPAGAVADDELAEYAGERGKWDWMAEVDARRFPGVARCFALFRELDREIAGLPTDQAFRHIVDRTLVLPLGAAAFEGAQRVANLRRLTAVAVELARDGRLSLPEVVAALGEDDLDQLKQDPPLADDAAEAVRISTMHAIKGLESDCVILPDLAGKSNGRTKSTATVLTRLPDGRPALAVKINGTPNSPQVWHELEDRRHEASEEVRVLYVALTRARGQLILLARRSRGVSQRLLALAPWGYDVDEPPEDGALIGDGRVLHRLFDPPGRERSERDEAPVAQSRAVEAYEAAVCALRARARAPFTAPSAAGKERAEPRHASGGESAAPGIGLVVGRVLHGVLETWDGAERSAFEEMLGRLTREEASVEGLDVATVETAARAIADGFFGSDLVRRFRSCKQLGREVPLLLQGEDDRLHRGIIDLLYEDDDGTVVVADYKTDAETDAVELARSYGDQLRLYAEGTHQALRLPSPPRRELWMLRTGRRIVL